MLKTRGEMLFKKTVISVLFLIYVASRVQAPDPSIVVTLCVFSGRPDPTWRVRRSRNKKLYDDIDTLLESVHKERMYYRDPPAWLGYKGFIVRESRRSKIVIGGRHTTALQFKLLETMPSNILARGNVRIVRDKISRLAEKASSHGTGSKSVKSSKTRKGGRFKRHTPHYNPHPWNASDYAIECNNCYNYANQIFTHTIAQPGVRFGLEFRRCTPNEVQEAALNDGLRLLENPPSSRDPPPRDPGGRTKLLALVVDPEIRADPHRDIEAHDGDFHWYLLNNDGTWSHKPGQTEVTRVDDDGYTIRDPRRASMGRYRFVSFMTSDPHEVRITECDYNEGSMNTNNDNV